MMDQSNTSKPSDTYVMKRIFSIPGLSSELAMGVIIDNLLRSLGGVRSLNVDYAHSRVIIAYDATKCTYQKIENVLNMAGYSTTNGWWPNIKSAWYRFLDENAQANAQSPGGACCNNPTNIYVNRRK